VVEEVAEEVGVAVEDRATPVPNCLLPFLTRSILPMVRTKLNDV